MSAWPIWDEVTKKWKRTGGGKGSQHLLFWNWNLGKRFNILCSNSFQRFHWNCRQTKLTWVIKRGGGRGKYYRGKKVLVKKYPQHLHFVAFAFFWEKKTPKFVWFFWTKSFVFSKQSKIVTLGYGIIRFFKGCNVDLSPNT